MGKESLTNVISCARMAGRQGHSDSFSNQ